MRIEQIRSRFEAAKVADTRARHRRANIAAASLERSGALLVFTDGRWMHTNTGILSCDILGDEFGIAESAVRLGLVSEAEVQEHRAHVLREHAEREAKFEHLQYLRLKEKYEGST